MTTESVAGVAVAEPPAAGTTRVHGGEVRRLREARGISCPALAEIVGIDRRTLNKIENGLLHGSARTRFLIARALGVDLSAFTYTVASRRRSRPASRP